MSLFRPAALFSPARIIPALALVCLASGWLNPPAARASLSPVTLPCLVYGADYFGVPSGFLLAIMAAEGGRVGRISRNPPSGTYDIGPMQVNSLWLPVLAKRGITLEQLRDNGCVNVAVAAWIFKNHFLETGDLYTSLAYYHSRDPRKGRAYAAAALKAALSLKPEKTLKRANGSLVKK
jgi:soluble lytic murein transglycosylase-like protein